MGNPSADQCCTIAVESQPDDHGRQRFSAEWVIGGRQRGQCFNANLEACVEHFRTAGFTVTVKELES